MNQLKLNSHHFNTSYNFKFAETQKEFLLLKNLRIEVFVKEQSVPIDEEIDKIDFYAHHAIAIHQKLVIFINSRVGQPMAYHLYQYYSSSLK